MYLDCAIAFGLYDCYWILLLQIWHRGCSITFSPPPPPPVTKSCAKHNCVDCSCIMSIVFGLCQLYLDCVNCIWIVRFYLDCMIVFGLYNCIWIVQLYLDCTIAGFGTGGIVLPIPPPCAKNLCQKGFDRLYLDCVDCIWIV